MAKSKRNKNGKLNSRVQQRIVPRATRWKDILTKWLGFILALGTFVTILVGIWQAYIHTTPEIHVTDSDPQAPFLFPFSIKNDSIIFDMHNVQYTCHIRHMEFGNENTFNNVNIINGGAIEIPANSIPENYRCPVGITGIPINSLIIDVSVNYKTLWVQRSYTLPFTWMANASSPKWIEGDIH